jgi:hypothetical protein
MGGPCRPWKDLEPGRCTMPTPHPRHLTSRPQHLASRPRHLPTSRWPWRLELAAFGLTTAALAALSPRPPCCPPTASTTPDTRPHAADRPPGRAGTQARTDAHHRPAGANHLAHPSAPTPDTVPRASSRATGAPGTATTQAPGTTTITTAFSSAGYHHPAPGDRPDHHSRADHHTQPTTSGPTTTGTEPTTTTGPAIR